MSPYHNWQELWGVLLITVFVLFLNILTCYFTKSGEMLLSIFSNLFKRAEFSGQSIFWKFSGELDNLVVLRDSSQNSYSRFKILLW